MASQIGSYMTDVGQGWLMASPSQIGSYMTDLGQGWLMASLTPSPLIVSCS